MLYRSGFISFFDLTTSIVIIDEIGKMECFSEKFRLLVKALEEFLPDIILSDYDLPALYIL
jgi:nucleoside-triphosphatase THEP1